MRTGDLADIVGVQVAWWQLGFRGRRAVRRRARHGGTGPGDEVGRAWAMQVLLAPWWWRAARAAVAGGAALLVVIVAEVGLLAEIDDATVAVLLTVLSSLGVTALLTWRQTRWAREIAGPAGEHARPESVVTRQLRLGVALLLAVAVLSVFLQASAESVSVDADCPVYLPPDPHFPWVAEGHSATDECPTSRPLTRSGGISWYQEANGDYLYWFPSIHALLTMSPAMVTAWLEYRPLLGDPVDSDRHDGDSRYINFAHGYLLDAPGKPVVVAPGSHQPQLGPVSCAAMDRPCLTEAEQNAGGAVELDWKFPVADGYNVSYWVSGRPGATTVEVARTHFTLDHPEPGVLYGFQVQACTKHFLSRSTCTPNSNSVAVQTRP